MSGGFCFCKGELVECSAGRVQDCNVKQIHECPKDSEPFGGFCFCKGEMVRCSAGRVQDCNVKQVRKCPKEQ